MMSKNSASPPHSLEAEQSVLGGLMLENDRWDSIASSLSAQDFFNPAHQLIFNQMNRLVAQNKPIDLITLSESLEQSKSLEKVGGFAYLAELSKYTPSAANIEAYGEYVTTYGRLRQLLALGHELMVQAGSPRSDVLSVIEFAERKLYAIADNHSNGGLIDIPKCFDRIISTIAERYDSPENSISGTPLGLDELDALTFGLQPGDLIIVAARPSMGKTAFALTACANALQLRPTMPVQIYSMEMPAEHLLLRFISMLGQISQSRLRSGNLTEEDWDQIGPAANVILSDWKNRLLIDDSSTLTPALLRSRTRRSIRQFGQPSLIVVDYLQLMNAPGYENRTQEITEISRSLKVLAKETGCPVMALSQLNRAVESRQNKRPCNGDLRESGAIEQDADLIFFLYRDEIYNPNTLEKGTAEIIIGKQRNGPTGTAKIQFISDQTRFASPIQGR
jgi:replicative DNA helicase